jgi:hypothetical protein
MASWREKQAVSSKAGHIGNCLKADPAYGEGVAIALGIPLSEVLKKKSSYRASHKMVRFVISAKVGIQKFSINSLGFVC